MLMAFEVGTQRNRITLDCLECAIVKANEFMENGTKVYIRDTHKNKIVYGNYF